MKINEVRGKDETELRVDLQSLRKELFDLRFKGVSEQNPNPSRILQVRRDVARILTIMRERELGLVRSQDGKVTPATAAAPAASPAERRAELPRAERKRKSASRKPSAGKREAGASKGTTGAPKTARAAASKKSGRKKVAGSRKAKS